MDIILGIVVIAVALLAMSVGIIFNNKPLRGSCGGQSGKITIDGIEVTCPTCGGDTEKCDQNQLTEKNQQT
jgi:hypothetical protein